MPNFIQLHTLPTLPPGSDPVWVNLDHVRSLHPQTDHIWRTRLEFSRGRSPGEEMVVEETCEEIVRLASAHSVRSSDQSERARRELAAIETGHARDPERLVTRVRGTFDRIQRLLPSHELAIEWLQSWDHRRGDTAITALITIDASAPVAMEV